MMQSHISIIIINDHDNVKLQMCQISVRKGGARGGRSEKFLKRCKIIIEWSQRLYHFGRPAYSNVLVSFEGE